MPRPIKPLLLIPSNALACTTCQTPLAESIRAAIFGPDFFFNLAVTLVPFLVFLTIAAAIHYGVPTLTRHRPKRETL